MKRDIVLKGIVTTAFVLNMQFFQTGYAFSQNRMANLNQTLKQTRIGRLVRLGIKEDKKVIAKVKNIVV